MYSPGRWKVYSCSLRASSKMTVPESRLCAARQMAAAMSKTCVRRLMAGTVKPWTSPRPRAMYSSWMDADGQPSSCDASQTIQRAASTVAGSSLKVALQMTSRMPRPRNAAGSLMARASPSRSQMPSSSCSSAAGDAATVGWVMGIPPLA